MWRGVVVNWLQLLKEVLLVVLPIIEQWANEHAARIEAERRLTNG